MLGSDTAIVYLQIGAKLSAKRKPTLPEHPLLKTQNKKNSLLKPQPEKASD